MCKRTVLAPYAVDWIGVTLIVTPREPANGLYFHATRRFLLNAGFFKCKALSDGTISLNYRSPKYCNGSDFVNIF